MKPTHIHTKPRLIALNAQLNVIIYLIKLLALVDDEIRVNINIQYTWCITCSRCWGLEASVLINTGS